MVVVRDEREYALFAVRAAGSWGVRSGVCSTAMVCRGSCVTQTRSSNHLDGVRPVVASDLVAAPG